MKTLYNNEFKQTLSKAMFIIEMGQEAYDTILSDGNWWDWRIMDEEGEKVVASWEGK